ncbi:nicotinate-nucleotide adenylyltransferase [Patescibacteria group bacterium]|nr:nicotinate-nucleotide adenylyltransferase [Patescibacteria group bacterium]
MEKKLSNGFKIGILGGAFNPPHKGHLLIAEKVLKKFNLNKIFFIPAGVPALKKKELAPAKDRLEMTKLLIKGKPNFSVLDYEIRKKKKAYTLETVGYLKNKLKGAKIFWLIGEDSFREIVEGKWEKSRGLLDLAQFIIITRTHHPYNLKTLPKKFKKKLEAALKKVVFLKLTLPVSATKIREKIKREEDVKDYLTKEVLGYIKRKRLYCDG